jgi:putative transport protein
MGWVEELLVRYPELALFLAIALGYAFGEISFGGFQFGPVTGSLLAGLLIGQFAVVPVTGLAKSFLFLLFLFGIGYSVGPQFMQAAKRDGLNSIILAFLCTTTGLAVAYFIANVLGLDPGLAAGLLSGALTQSAAMGTASETIGALPSAACLSPMSPSRTRSATCSARSAPSGSAAPSGRACCASI